jgi:hypothetical protein
MYDPAEHKKKVYEIAVAGGRHKGTYNDALKKSNAQLWKSFQSHMHQVEIHQDKISRPEQYAPDWDNWDAVRRMGLVQVWRKHLRDNYDKALIEQSVLEERFNEPA